MESSTKRNAPKSFELHTTYMFRHNIRMMRIEEVTCFQYSKLIHNKFMNLFRL